MARGCRFKYEIIKYKILKTGSEMVSNKIVSLSEEYSGKDAIVERDGDEIYITFYDLINGTNNDKRCNVKKGRNTSKKTNA